MQKTREIQVSQTSLNSGYLQVPGPYLGMDKTNELMEILYSLIEEKVMHVVIDLNEIERMNSIAIGKLLYFQNLLYNQGGSLRIQGLKPEVLDLLRMLKIDDLLT